MPASAGLSGSAAVPSHTLRSRSRSRVEGGGLVSLSITTKASVAEVRLKGGRRAPRWADLVSQETVVGANSRSAKSIPVTPIALPIAHAPASSRVGPVSS